MNCQEMYAEAHKAYKKENNLTKAKELYERVISECPGTEESRYSVAQIQNIKSEMDAEQEDITKTNISSHFTWVQSIKLWWAIAWRQTLITFIPVALAPLVADKLFSPPTALYAGIILQILIGLPIFIGVQRHVIANIKFRDFSLVVKKAVSSVQDN